MNTKKLLNYLNTYLSANKIKDYCPNGLQVEGGENIQRIITGVTASQALIDQAVEQKADAIIVHHGYFWKGEPAQVVGMKKNRLKTLLENDINLIAYHLPLDVHPEVGNNAQLAQLLGLTITGGMTPGDPMSVGNLAELSSPVQLDDFAKLVAQKLNRDPLVEAAGKNEIKTVALCTGGAQDFIDQAALLGADLYITGEVSERTILSARELGINFIAAGHHATERYGVKALGEHLAKEFKLDVAFIDIDNPA
ncbi:Nif3-like dinuclear metal center hexameric protein [Catenovulum sp. SM1970]|uniref:Nif3-like dinuclear metal center hexameric protein n=1 Tax=Marinifaba aquimaris TaxID=2741323 RepID=UPI00157437AD|nr:Nif3-like dinuclear metal center hexameric protein [Marinifaba aquimaris]NTS78722.1 Nif3-like dinuclear metal center hexameric protein [Marinifaba aquimaris]